MRRVWGLLLGLTVAGCDGSTGNADACADLDAELLAETERITSCERDADCGQAVTGTSTEPSCDLVARNDADVTVLEGLIEESAAGNCSFPFERPTDCPDPVGAICTDDGVCEWDWGD